MARTTALNAAWQRLQAEAERLRHRSLHALFETDPQRSARFARQALGFYVDFSRQLIDDEALKHLLALAEAADVAGAREALFTGAPVNVTENRPALHTALRQQTDAPVLVDGEDVIPAIRAQQRRMGKLVARLHAGQWRGYSGRAITDVVHLGVGGSDLGPQLVVDALKEFRHPHCNVGLHFVANLDGGELARTLARLNPETTLFVVTSKTFTTVDTLTNAASALAWLEVASGLPAAELKRLHFIGISAAAERVDEWGIPADHQLRFWAWVGGRYSLWSTVGFAIALWLGMEGFTQLLAGAAAMDDHYRTAPAAENLPLLLALIDVWNHNLLGAHAHAVLPYDARLALLPRYLAQLEMESNGKSVQRDGTPVTRHTAAVLWGETGPTAQHAFYQLLHQGTETIWCDFITAVRADEWALPDVKAHQRLNLANCLAQAQALAFGADHPDPHRRYPGNRPSTLLLMDALSPWQLGALLALYEHKVHASAVIWNINPFDQWGVELGKRIAGELCTQLEKTEDGTEDSSLAPLLNHIRQVMRT